MFKEQLLTIFRLIYYWKAIFLLNKANVFIQLRFSNILYNAFVLIFLRIFKYYREIIIFTINRIKNINDAIQNRILVILYYGLLGLDIKKTI